MEGKGTPKNEQNQFCHSPSVKAMTPSEVERQDSHAAGVKYSETEVTLPQSYRGDARIKRRQSLYALVSLCAGLSWESLLRRRCSRWPHNTGNQGRLAAHQRWRQ